jgi:hypothetical protein
MPGSVGAAMPLMYRHDSATTRAVYRGPNETHPWWCELRRDIRRQHAIHIEVLNDREQGDVLIQHR